MDVKAIKQLEGQLAEAREKGKVELLADVNTKIAQLKDIGFEYELVANGHKKIGRPKKEKLNGTV